MVLQFPSPKDFLSPNFNIKVNDVFIPDEVYPFIKSVSWEQDEQLIDMIIVVLDNTGFQFTDTNIFEMGNTIELLGGYKNNLVSMGQAVIENWIPRFPQSGEPTIEIKAFSPARLLMEEFGGEVLAGDVAGTFIPALVAGPLAGKIRTVWKRPISHSEVVRDIVKNRGLGFDFDIVDTPILGKKSVTRKKEEKDWDLIKRMAKLNDYDFWIDYDSEVKKHILHFIPFQESKKSEFTLRYNSGERTNIDFVDLDVNLPGQTKEIQLIGWDSTIGETIRITVKSKPKKRNERKFDGQIKKIDFQLRTGQDVILDSVGSTPIKIVSSRKWESEAEGIKFAENLFRQQERAFATANVGMPGLPGLKTRQVYQIEGLGTRFSGKYYVINVVQKFMGGDSGFFQTSFNAKRIVEL